MPMKQNRNQLHNQMETVRRKMLVSAQKWGMSDQRTIQVSQELDALIYKSLIKG